jgi:hypothetical protein
MGNSNFDKTARHNHSPRSADMTGKERMAAAMSMRRPDRVPVMCQLSLGHYFIQCPSTAVEIWHSSEAFADSLIQLQQRYRFDGILVNLPGRNPDWPASVRSLDRSEGKTVIRWKNGWYTVCPDDDNPHVFRENGSRFFPSFAEIDPEKLFYVEPHGIVGVTYPQSWGFDGETADRNDFFPPWYFDSIDRVIRRVGTEISVHGEIFSPFSQFMELLNYSNGLLALMEDPEKCEACLDGLARGAIVLGRKLAGRGADAILISSAFAGAGFISPDQYRRFVLPFEKKIIGAIREESRLPIYTHTCGSIGDRLELMESTGTNGIDTLDPPPLGNVRLDDAKKRIGSRLFIKGNLDPVGVLLNGSAQTVLTEARKCLEQAASGGGYILSSACSVPPHAPAENISLLYEAVEEFGRYG